MPELRLDSFEMDESNKFALALLGAIVQLEEGYSPLLIHGDHGSGKTHLLSALSTELALVHPEISLLYIPDDFPIEKMLLGGGADSNGDSDEFIYKAYSRKEFLIIDDIERFCGDAQIRDRFYSLFDAFVDNAKQVVLTSASPIEELEGFNERFRSRLRGGIDARLSPPQPEGRLKILKRECDRLGLKLGVDVLQLLMGEAGADVKYLKKLPGHIKTFATLNRQRLTKKKVEEFLAVVRAEAGKDRGAATAEQVYGSWVQAQARKQEEKLTTKIEELEKRLSEQAQKADEWKEKLETAKSLQQSAAAEGSGFAAQIQQLELGLKEKDDRLSELENEISRKSKDLASGEDRQKKVEEVINELQSEITRLKKSADDELLSLKIQIEDKDQNLELLREEREMRAAEHEKEKAELVERAADLQNQHLLLKGTIEDLSGRIRELEENVVLKQAELADVAKLKNAGSEKHKTLRKQVQEAHAKLQAESERHSAEIKEKAARERQLLASLDSKEKDLEAVRKEAEAQNAQWQSRFDSISEKLQQSESKTAAIEEKLKSESEKTRGLEAELGSARAELEGAGGQHQAQLAQIEELAAERDNLRKHLSTLDANVAELTKAAEERGSLISGKDAEINELNAALDELKNQLGERERLFGESGEKAAESIRNLEEQLKQRDDDLRDIGVQLEGRTTELNTSNKDIETLNAEVSRLSDELAALGNEKVNLEADLANISRESAERLQAAEKQISDLQAGMAETEARATESAQQLEATRQASAKQIEEERKRSADLERSLSKAMASSETDLAQASKEIDGLRAVISKHEARLEEQKAAMAAKEKDAAENISRLKEDLKGRNDELQELSKNLAEREREIKSQDKTASRLNENISSIETKLKAASDQIDKFGSDAKAAEKDLKKHQRMLKSAQEETSRSAKLAKEKDRHIADLQRTLDSMRKELSKKSAKSAGAERKFSPLEAQLSEKEKALAVLRLDFAELQAVNDGLKNDSANAREQLEALESEKAQRDREIASKQEQIKQLESHVTELEQCAEEQSQQELLSRIEELESAVAEKDKEIEAAQAQKDEITGLKSKYEKKADSLKEQVKEAMKELVRVRENSEAQAQKHREEVEALLAKLAQPEAGAKAPETEEQPERQAVEVAAPQDISVEEKTDELGVSEEQDIPEEETEVTAEIRERSRRISWLADFESFQVSEGNAFSVSMAEKIARNPGELYNPLCIYGQANSGKTHIVHSVGDLSTSEDPDLICAMSSIESLLEVVQAGGSIVTDWLRTVRLLIIDDFQIADMSSDLQQKLYEFLKALVDKDAQVVIASEEPPIKMNYLQEYFLRFLEEGLLAKLELNPEVVESQQKAAEAFAAVAKAMVAPPKEEEDVAAGEAEEPEGAEAEPQEADAEPPRDFLDEFLSADSTLTASSFRGKRVFDEFEEAFKYPNKKWRNKFPLLVIEDDEERRKHFFSALTNRLGEMFSSPVSLLSIDQLAEMLALTPTFDWNGLLNKLAQSNVILINDCESVVRLPDSASGYLQAILEDISKHDTLLMIGTSKQYKKEPIFGGIYKKASRKRI